eukprot:g26134.t1
MIGDWKVLSFVMYRVQMLHRIVPDSALCLNNVEEASSEQRIKETKLADVQSPEMETEVQEGEESIGNGPGEFEVGVKCVRKVDELFELLVGARGGADTVIDIAEEEGGWCRCSSGRWT